MAEGEEPVPQSVENLIELLSARELQVYRLLGEGLSNSEITVRCCLSPKTVETYIARIKDKTGVVNGRVLLRNAIRYLEAERTAELGDQRLDSLFDR